MWGIVTRLLLRLLAIDKVRSFNSALVVVDVTTCYCIINPYCCSCSYYCLRCCRRRRRYHCCCLCNGCHCWSIRCKLRNAATCNNKCRTLLPCRDISLLLHVHSGNLVQARWTTYTLCYCCCLCCWLPPPLWVRQQHALNRLKKCIELPCWFPVVSAGAQGRLLFATIMFYDIHERIYTCSAIRYLPQNLWVISLWPQMLNKCSTQYAPTPITACWNKFSFRFKQAVVSYSVQVMLLA